MAADTPEPGRIHVTGTGEIDVAPDKATLTARLWEQTAFVKAENPEELKPDDMLKARQAVEDRVRNVILTLEGMGIESRHIEAGSLSIGQTQTHKRLDNGNHQRMIATRVERPIEVTLLDLEQVPEVLNTLTEQGVNHLSGVSYGVQDMDAARREALAEAIDNARLEAEVMASGLGVGIGRVVEVSRGQGGTPRPPQPMMARASVAESASGGPSQKAEYRAGETTVNAQGVEVVYVDLWSDQQRDPAQLIQAAIREAMAPHRSAIEKLATRLGISKVGLGHWIQIDTSPTEDGAASLPEALRLLIEAGSKPVALVIDEAQQAVTTEAGNTLMAALKSARDQLNTPDHLQLMLVMSGSDRDKLLRLVNSHTAPFYGSQIQQMPLLGKAFIEHIADLIERQQPAQAPVDRDMLLQAFTAYGYLPQLFMEALGQAMSPLATDGDRFEQRLLSLVRARQRDVEQDMASDYLGLAPLQQAVLWRVLEMGEGFRPYNAESLAFYQRITGMPVTAQQAQRALESLRERTPPLAWKSSRGEYAVEDAAMSQWFRGLVDAGHWPPETDE